VQREGNFCADVLAKAGNSSMEPFVLYSNPPTFVVSELLADSWGVMVPKFCNLILFNAFPFHKKKKKKKKNFCVWELDQKDTI
jgi:hypothetical protein